MSDETTSQKMDKDFFKRTDAFIKVANELTQCQHALRSGTLQCIYCGILSCG